jgi:hypothetical protein
MIPCTGTKISDWLTCCSSATSAGNMAPPRDPDDDEDGDEDEEDEDRNEQSSENQTNRGVFTVPDFGRRTSLSH